MWTQRFLIVYSSVVTAAFAGSILASCATTTKRARFDEITVQRVNIVEPDGTLRLVVSNTAKFPGAFFGNREMPRPDRQAAGLLFLNNEGTEQGGLIFGGAKDKDGQIRSNGHLSFDQYDQDQVFAIDAGQEGSAKRTMLVISDRGDWPLHDAVDDIMRIKALPPSEQQAAMQKFVEGHPGSQTRIVLGRATDKSALLLMQDPDGRNRIVLKVGGDGTPVLQFLDESGRVIDELLRRSGVKMK